MDIWTCWLIVAGIFMFLEIITSGFFVIWLGIAALFSMTYSFFFPEQIHIQIAIWVGISTLLILLTRRFTKKIEPKVTPTNVYSIIGKKAIVTQEINSATSTGQVKVDGDIWSAKTDSFDEVIPINSVVEIIRIDGVKTVVKKID